jgi:arylsulfatase I/J
MSTLFSCFVSLLILPQVKSVPNIVFIVADDLGWNNVGWHNPDNPEVVTPNMNSLVSEGIQLEAHYVHSLCTPSRSSMISGRFPVHVTQKLLNPDSQQCGIPQNMTGIGSKMQQGGYSTAIVGKWDVGMATPEHTPLGRGFDNSLIYFEHKNDYWDFGIGQSDCLNYDNVSYTHIIDLWDTDQPADVDKLAGGNNDYYEEFVFRDRFTKVINEHDSSTPLFLMYTPHVAHVPLQVPKAYFDKFAFMKDTDETQCITQSMEGFTPMTSEVYPGFGNITENYSCRAQYAAMINLMDDNIGELVQALVENDNMWDNTLLVFSSDNGGCILMTESAASNYPLRGGKYSDFEGGIKGAAFASGGYLPRAMRGTVSHTFMHITDWYTTFSILAGVDPFDTLADSSSTSAYTLPPVDGLDLWPVLSGQNLTSPHAELPISDNSLLDVTTWLKLVMGTQNPGGWSGFLYPNSTSADSDPSYAVDCTAGCLFNVSSDPSEHHDLGDELYDIRDSMIDRLNELKTGYFQNSDQNVDSCPDSVDVSCSCWMAANKYGGFYGPFQEVDV